MSQPRYAGKRDSVEAELLVLVEQLGGEWVCEGPLDGWVFCPRLWRGAMPVEIKDPACEGLVHEYTPKQKRCFSRWLACGIHWLVWRTADDVMRDLGARRTA